MSESLVLLAPAKINRTLRIFNKSSEYSLHPIASEFCAIDLCDRLFVTKIQEKKIKIRVEGIFSAGVPNNQENILYKMAEAFFAKYGFSFGLDIVLEKNIPTRSGLGGGSSDAAALLKILSAFVDKKNVLSPQEICAVGSDIPFFLQEKTTAFVHGYGEQISESLFSSPSKFGILVFPDRITVQSVWAYEELDALREKQGILSEYKNDFEAVLYPHFPDLRKIAELLKIAGAKEYGITGSGSALFGFFEEEDSRKEFLEIMPQRKYGNMVSFAPLENFFSIKTLQ